MASVVDESLSAEALFDDVGPAYEVAFANLPPQLESIDWLKEQLASHKPAKVLDIGCGTGRPVCSELAASGHHVLGIDVSSEMIEAAKRNVPQASFEKIDVSAYSCDSASFDAITVYFSLIASITQDQIRQYIGKIHEWLKPDGYLIFATVPIEGNSVPIKWMGRSIIVSGLSSESIIDCMKKVGFEIEYSNNSIFMPKAVEAGICNAEEIWEEEHLFVYARKV